ncbi:phage antirepressor KilAC domain-containing protein [Acinetobacter sp. YH12072]|uniref:phage antirepressor KilAC domain-containing protein n=1 Tax=Acinetobacter sp. YH12072 TaxID=2601068 RepID=UPI0015D32590|nr:phage antirepressor KilAC domain-containing protein [Acinetobacter sp. YH12072]
MNMLTQENFNINEVTMSSPEIVDFINIHRKEVATAEKPYKELRHDDFMRKVPSVLGEGHAPKFIGTQNYGNNNTRHIYNFPKREACLMAMSYSYELQAQVFDRMTAMEEALKAQKPVELSRMDLIQLALAAEQENIALKQHVAVLEPKAKGLDRIADCTNVLGIRESAKVLKIGQNQLVQYLLDHKVVYRDQYGKIQAYQKSIDQKLIHVVTSAPRLTESGEKVFTQVKLTQKLITRIAKWLEQGVAA